jgi:hypothetical protein
MREGRPVILAVDPSIRACGWAVVADRDCGGPSVYASGVWRPTAAAGSPTPLAQLAQWAGYTAGLYAPLAAVVVETPDGGDRHYRDAAGGRHAVRGSRERAYAMAVGVVVGAAVAAVGTDRVHLVSVNAWKGTRTKAQTRPAAVALLGREPVDDNESDAVGLALAFLDGLPASGPRPGKRGRRGYVDDRYAAAVADAMARRP